MKMNFKQKIWLDAGLILGSIAVAAVAVYFLSNDLNVQANKVISNKESLSGQNNSVEELALLKSQLPQAASYTAAMENLLPDQYGLINFGPWLNAIAARYNVVATYAFLNNPTLASVSAPGTMGFSLSVQGPQGSVDKFLKDIESQSAGFLLTLSSFDFTANSTGESLNAQGILFFQ
jgi:hypothetical protein